MARPHLGAVVGVAVVGVLFGVGVTQCAAPTQIIVTVRGDEELCNGKRSPLNQTGIAVTAPDKIDTDPIDIYQDNGCPNGLEVGALTITPSGDDTAQVGIRVVAALGSKNADACNEPGVAGCIIAKRTSRFAPGATQYVEVFLSAKCVDSECPSRGLECDPNSGACVSAIQEDGAVSEPDAGVSDSAPNFDAKADACSNCSRPNMVCSPATGLCEVACSEDTPCNGTIGGPALEFRFTCAGLDSCNNLRCLADKCAFDCQNSGGPATDEPLCSRVTCQAKECLMQCGRANGCSNVVFDGGKNDITCNVTGSGQPSCNNIHCGVAEDGTCTRRCNNQGEACGPVTSCTPDGTPACAAWARADAGGDGGG